MATRTVRALFFVGAALFGTTVLPSVRPAFAESKVGVTSVADGDPLGKPPTEAERVLRIGIDVQANEIVTTHANDRAHLVFLDGSSLTVGPNARLTIDKFVYDPHSKTGDLAITASQGVFRLVGGKISKTNAININTPSGTIGIRGGITMFGVSQRSTTANFIFGNSMTVTGQGLTQTATRPGSQVIVNFGAPPSLPSLLPPGGAASLMSQLETGSNSSGAGGNADQKSQSSGFSSINSGQQQNAQNAIQGGLPPNTNNNTLTQVVSNTNPATNPNNPSTTTTTTSTTQPGSQTSPPGNTTPKTAQTLQGYVGGLLVASAGRHSITTGLSGAQPGDLRIRTNAENSTAKAKVIIRGLDGSIISPNATLKLGSGRHGGSFFQDDQNYITATVNGRATIRAGEETIMARDTSVLLTTSQVPGGSYVGVSCSVCDFLTFGEWETAISTRRYRGPTAVATQAPWVAGTLATELPNTQSASFSGGMWGQAQNGNSAIRNVTGSFGMSYSWGAGTGTWNANFDNRTYTGNVAGSGGVSFAGSNIAATTGNRTMSVNGSFFTSPAAAGGVAGVAGQFGARGPQYQASGVFGGAKLP
jgi:hypothetical protein